MGCRNAVIPKILLRKGTVDYLTYEETARPPNNEYLCLFRARAFQLRGTQRLVEETSKMINSFNNKLLEFSTNLCQRFRINYCGINEVLLTLNILLFDIDIVDEETLSETLPNEVCRNIKFCETAGILQIHLLHKQQ